MGKTHQSDVPMIKQFIHSLWLCLVLVQAVAASTLDISAEFKPSAFEPGNVQFKNTTPLSGYCHGNTSHCRPGDFTLLFPLEIRRTWVNPGPVEGHSYQQVDGNWKSINVVSEDGETVRLEFRLNLLARRYYLGSLQPGGIPGAGGIGVFANSAGVNGSATGGCAGRIGSGHATLYDFAWGVPLGNNRCTRGTRNVESGPYSGLIDRVSVGYELRTPNPFALGNGAYRGEITYSVGHGQQIDLGNGDYSENSLTFRFDLKVEHQLRVDFPAGSNHALLEPPGGWSDWLHRGKAPTRLYRDHPFVIWASAPMKIYLTCQDLQIGQQCAMVEQNSTQPMEVPIDVAISLPGTVQYNGAAVNRLPLPVGQANALQFQSIAVSTARQGALHYSVNQAHVERMLTRSGSTFKGVVTLVIEADI